jgi:hypothetical protein
MPKVIQWVIAPATGTFAILGERLTELLEGKLLTEEASLLDYL